MGGARVHAEAPDWGNFPHSHCVVLIKGLKSALPMRPVEQCSRMHAKEDLRPRLKTENG